MVSRLHPSRRMIPIGIGASAGGLSSIARILSSLPTGFRAPILVSQHMPTVSSSSVAEYLRARAPYEVVEVEPGMPLRSGRCYVPPVSRHIVVRPGDDGFVLDAPAQPERDIWPSVDVMLRSLADQFGMGCVAVILSGMGTDGLEGCRGIERLKGQIIVQDEASSAIWGMPGAIVRAGIAHEILPLSRIPSALVLATRGARSWRAAG